MGKGVLACPTSRGAVACPTGRGWLKCPSTVGCCKTGAVSELDIVCCFSTDSRLSVSLVSTMVATGSASWVAFINFVNAYLMANPTFTIPFNNNQGGSGSGNCDGYYFTDPASSFWIKQIGTLNGAPVWLDQNFVPGAYASGYHIRFQNGTFPEGSGGSFFGFVQTMDTSGTDGNCYGTPSLNTFLSDVSGGDTLTGDISGSLVVENNHCCRDLDDNCIIGLPDTDGSCLVGP